MIFHLMVSEYFQNYGDISQEILFRIKGINYRIFIAVYGREILGQCVDRGGRDKFIFSHANQACQLISKSRGSHCVM